MLFTHSTLVALAASLSFSVSDAHIIQKRAPAPEKDVAGWMNDVYKRVFKRQEDACVPSNDYYQCLSSHVSASDLCRTLIGQRTSTVVVPYTGTSTLTQVTSTRTATVNNFVSVTVTSTTTVGQTLRARAPEPTEAPVLDKRAANVANINNYIRQVQSNSTFDSTAFALKSISSGLSSACDCLGLPGPRTTTSTYNAQGRVS
ncbi:hypothetical protein IWX91DRAFT_328014 [Phyllosticta citricarpa]